MRGVALRNRIAELEAELAALRGKPQHVVAGEPVKRGVMLVVDEETLEAFAHGATKTIPGRRKVWGTAKRRAKKGERVTIKHWLCEDDCGADCHLCAHVNP